jgi:hypothetical protein
MLLTRSGVEYVPLSEAAYRQFTVGHIFLHDGKPAMLRVKPYQRHEPLREEGNFFIECVDGHGERISFEKDGRTGLWWPHALAQSIYDADPVALNSAVLGGA